MKVHSNLVVATIFTDKNISKATVKFPFPHIISKHRLSLFAANNDIINTKLPSTLPQVNLTLLLRKWRCVTFSRDDSH